MSRIKLLIVGLLVCAVLLPACQPQTVVVKETIKETVVVEKEIEKEVTKVVEKEIAKEVTKVVKEEVVVTATPQTIAYWDPAEVTAASGPEKCVPVAALPKELSKPWKLGFIHVLKSHPFHGVVGKGAMDAAAFYGADWVEVDTGGAGGTAAIDMANTLLLDKPDVIGIIGQGPQTRDPIAQAAYDNGAIFLGIDCGKSDWSPYIYGIGDARSGKVAGQLMAEGLAEKMAGDWKGRELFFVEMTHSGIAICLDRTGALRDVAVQAQGLDADHVILADMAAVPDLNTFLLDQLNAHPDGVFAFTGCWDGMAIGPYNAAKEAGREADLILVTMGGDQTPAEMLACKPVGFYGYLEFQPYCEGWNWAVTALAILEGERYEPYTPQILTTQDTIEARFQELYGNLPACK
jgi:ABC-type sugar transport system substrate-binding protein